jgi:hypothetical protein
MANVINFFKFLEDKADRRVPLKLKLLNDPESITEKDLYVYDDLDLSDSGIKTLPDNLTIRYSLDLTYCPIKTLPKNLKVGGNLVLYESEIESLPKDLEVEGDLNIRNTPLANKYLDKFSVGQLLWSNKEAYAENQVIKSIAYLGGSVYLHK